MEFYYLDYLSHHYLNKYVIFERSICTFNSIKFNFLSLIDSSFLDFSSPPSFSSISPSTIIPLNARFPLDATTTPSLRGWRGYRFLIRNLSTPPRGFHSSVMEFLVILFVSWTGGWIVPFPPFSNRRVSSRSLPFSRREF